MTPTWASRSRRSSRSAVGQLGDGRMAVISPRAELAAVAEALQPQLSASDELQAPVVLLTAEQAKGLEFDVVMIVEPQQVAAEGVHGARALFVAMTRPTQRLLLVQRGSG